MINDRSAIETLFLAIGLAVVIISALVLTVKIAQIILNRFSRKEEEA